MLHIAIIDPVGQKAGLDHYDRSLATALNDQFCNVRVYSNFNCTGNEPTVINHFTFTFRKGLFQLVRLFKQYFSALRSARAENTDIVILHLFHSSFIDYLFIRLAVYFRFRVCLIVHDVESLIPQRVKSMLIKCVNLSTFVVVHNNSSYHELIKRINPVDKDKVSVIPHGHFLGVKEEKERHVAAEYFKLDSNKIYLLFFGIIKKSKGLEVLIEAMKDIPPNVDLIIAGRTRDINFNHYEKLIDTLNLSQRVHKIIRYITNTERNLLLNFAGFVILPYQRIYQSGVLLLAMSYGVPVIASDIPSNKIITHDKNGILFKVGNSSDLASKINGLMADDKKRNSISRQAREYVSLNNNWKKIGNEFIKIFK